MNFKQQDNATFDQKVALRKIGLSLLDDTPIIMETHAGIGDIYSAIYHKFDEGVALEKDTMKCSILAHQRPSWAVYQADSPIALKQGAGNHLAVNFLDLDPYGDCWPTINGFFSSNRQFSKRMIVAVNDGLRQSVRGGRAWKSNSLAPIVPIYGNNIWHEYIAICEKLLELAISQVGYHILKFDGYYAGKGKTMTHFLAVLEK